MDESWRMKMGVSAASAGSKALKPEDFKDVFGGPPRSLLAARKLSADFSANDWFYAEIFQPLESDSSDVVSGQRLPEFIPPRKKCSKKTQVSNRRMCRSKSTSSSVMSCDELYQLHNFGSETVIGEDDVADLSSSTTKLRPINVSSRWTTTSTSMIPKSNHKRQNLPTFGCPNTTFLKNSRFIGNECNDYVSKSLNNFGHHQTVSSPETNKEHCNFNMPVDSEYHMHQVSPSTPVSSSICRSLEDPTKNNIDYQENVSYYKQHLLVEDYRTMSSYDSTINSSMMEVNIAKAIDIDEAIAWAKEKFQGCSLNDEG
ncbi:Nuclease SbcCD subunit C [Bienertia sinuspersici]